MPSSHSGACQRHTQVFDLPVRRIISLVTDTVCARQDDLGPPDMLMRCVAIPYDRAQTAAINRLEKKFRFACARLACNEPDGIAPRIEMLDLITATIAGAADAGGP